MISDCCASSNYCSSNVPISDAVNCIVHRLYNVACKLQIHNTITTHITHTQALSSVFIHTNIYSKVYINLYRATCAMPLMRSRDDLSYGITQCYLPPDTSVGPIVYVSLHGKASHCVMHNSPMIISVILTWEHASILSHQYS